VKAAFRLLADSGFGGERSQGWGHAAAPEFTEGWLPEMILPAPAAKPAEASVRQPADLAPLLSPPSEPSAAPSPTPGPEGAVAELPAPDPESASPVPSAAPSQSRDREAAGAELPPPDTKSVSPTPEAAVEPPPNHDSAPAAAHWLLSLFTPAPSDRVDWTRGNYALVARAGRVASSGELKKTGQMIAEGSVLYAASALSGNARDVAPDGLAHPVFRAGFAVSVPLPEVG
jgi:hypothetical protein